MSGPLPSYLSPLTTPAAWVYERIIDARNRRYDRGNGVEKLDVPVISVGNITTGGTGKTPMVMWIAEFLRSHSIRPAIAMRGYGASPGKADESDEAQEYAERLPDVPVIVHSDRLTAARQHVRENPSTECVILDDGFQHRRVHRDLDLVLIDATRDTFREPMLPAGHLREPLRNLARADAVIVTRVDSAGEEAADEKGLSDLESQVKRYHGHPPVARSRHNWSGLRIISSESHQRVPTDWLRGKRLVTLLGVGNPRSIIAQLDRAGSIVAADIPADDHERFTPSKLTVAKGLCDGLDGLAMTAKDWVRARTLIDLPTWPCPIVVPELEIEVSEGRETLEELILTAVAKKHSK